LTVSVDSEPGIQGGAGGDLADTVRRSLIDSFS